MFKNPFSFDGRIRRTEYALSYLVYMVAIVLISNLATTIGEGGVYLNFAAIPLIWFLLAQGAKRCHDRGNSG